MASFQELVLQEVTEEKQEFSIHPRLRFSLKNTTMTSSHR
jgi:hypothetical protein